MIATMRDLQDELKKMAHAFDFTDQRLGQHLCDAAVDGILTNMQAELDPDGIPWAPLSHSYELWKYAVAPGRSMGYLYGLMTEIGQLRGVQDVYPDWMTQRYGITTQADAEARQFNEGGARLGTNQPPRPFYGFTQDGINRINLILDGRFITHTGG